MHRAPAAGGGERRGRGAVAHDHRRPVAGVGVAAVRGAERVRGARRRPRATGCCGRRPRAGRTAATPAGGPSARSSASTSGAPPRVTQPVKSVRPTATARGSPKYDQVQRPTTCSAVAGRSSGPHAERSREHRVVRSCRGEPDMGPTVPPGGPRAHATKVAIATARPAPPLSTAAQLPGRTRPAATARRASTARFWFCGTSSPISKRSKSWDSVPFTRVDGDHELIGDRAVRRGHAAVGQRPAQRLEHAELRGRDGGHVQRAGDGRRRGSGTGRDEAIELEPHGDHVAAVEAAAGRDALAVDERPVAREPLVGQPPSSLRCARWSRAGATPRGPSAARDRPACCGRS